MHVHHSNLTLFNVHSVTDRTMLEALVQAMYLPYVYNTDRFFTQMVLFDRQGCST